MRRLLLPLLTVLVLAAAAAPAAHAAPGMLSVMMDDDQLLYRGDDMRDFTMRRMKEMGVDYVRVSVLWEVVAENAKRTRARCKGKGRKRKCRPGRLRRNFRADDPRTYPRTNWDRYDRLVQAGRTLGVGIYFNVTGPGPRWAHKKAPRSLRRYRRAYKPKPREYFKFVKAVGRRYDGTYVDENDGRRTLPRVTFWSLWNEPNQNGWLLPQWENGVPASPRLYRELWYYGRTALGATGHGSDVIVAGETAPLGSSLRNSRSPIYPKRFIRELFCISASGEPYTGASARRRGCGLLRKIGHWDYTAWAHHPYTKLLGPTERDRSRDAVTMANIGELWTLLDQIGARTGYVPQRNLIASTEFGYETNPPDRFVGISLGLQAEYLNVGDYMAWKDPRMITQTQFLLRDVPRIKRYRKRSKKSWFTYQSGLVYANGTAKPAAAAYRFPFVITGKGTDSAGQAGVNFWGWLRFLPRNTPTEVLLQFRPEGSTQFTNIGDPVKVDDPDMFWTAHRAVSARGTWRAVWRNPITGTPLITRDAAFRG